MQKLAARHQQKDKALIASEKARQQLLKNLLKQKAVSQVLGELNAIPGTSSQEKKDLYELPPIVNEDDNSDLESIQESYSSESEEDLKKNKRYKDLHSIDVHSADFKALPADIRHDILSELKERRKENSWGRIHEMPEDLGQFSNFQMNRLLKRRSVQVSLEEAEKEMGGRTLSLGDVEALLAEQGIQTSSDVGSRIASDNVTRFLYITDSTKANDKIVDTVEIDKNINPEDEKNNTKDNLSKDIPDSVLDNKNDKTLNHLNEKDKSYDKESLSIVKEEFTESAVFDNIKIEDSDSSSDEITFEDLNEEFEMNRKLILENRGLTQEQLLCIIKEQNKKCNDDINKVESRSENRSTQFQEDTSGNSRSSNQKINLEVISERYHSKLETDSDNTCDKNLNTDNQKDLDDSKNEISSIANEFPKGIGKTTSSTNEQESHKYKDSITTLNLINNSEISSDDNSIEVNQPLSVTKGRSVVNSPDGTILQVTINTKSNTENNDEDIFADIFDDINNKAKEIEPLQNNCDSKTNDVEIMTSSDTSSSENEERIVGCENSSEVGITVADEDSVHEETVTCKYFTSPKTEDNQAHVDTSVCTVTSARQESSHVTNEEKKNFEVVNESYTEESKKPAKKLTTKELSTLQTILEKQEGELLQKQGKEERLASTVTEQMRIEAQELLQLFGVPWVMAPMEAEAQCAFLDRTGLTQGTITDDSDIWLFGARKVYKNFFNQKKFVLQFQAQDIQHYFKLSRGDLIELALLVGSDYTIGVTGVGPVTALEILAMFRPATSNDSSVYTTLSAFKNWLQHPSNSNSPLSRKLKDVHLEDGFPNKDVIEAYLHPLVDESEEPFSWGFPDLAGLREFTKRKFGWSQTRTDEILLPVIKNLSQKTTQAKIDSYFHIKPAIPVYKDKVSQRVQKAIYRLGGNADSVSSQFESASGSSSQVRRQRSRGGTQIRKALGRGRGATLQIEPPPPAKPIPYPVNEELIPQRERDRLEALKRRLEAVEVLKKKKAKTNKKRPPKAPIKSEANLSESSSDDN